MLVLQRLEPDDIRLLHGKWQDAHRHHLKLRAHVVDRRHVLRREIAHDRAAVGDALDDPLLFQFEQREPDVTAMGIEVRAQILLDQPLARVAAAKHDVLLELARDQAGDRRLARLKIGRRRLKSADGFSASLRDSGFLEVLGVAMARNLPPTEIVYN